MKYTFIIAMLIASSTYALDFSKVDLDIRQKNPGDFGTQVFTLYYGKCESQKEFNGKEYEAHQKYIKDKKSNNISKIQAWMDESLENMSRGTKCD